MSNILVGTIRLSKNNSNTIASYIIYNDEDNITLTLTKSEIVKALKSGKKIIGLRLDNSEELETTINSIYSYLSVFLDRYETYQTPVVITAELSNGTYNVFGYVFKEKNDNKLLNNYCMYNTSLKELLEYGECQTIVNGTIINDKIVPIKENEPFKYIELGFTNHKGAATNLMLNEITPELKLTDTGLIYLSKVDVTKETELDELYIPSGVKGIRARGFQRSPYKRVCISGTECKEIGVRAFSEMKNLEEIQLNIGLEKIGISAFAECEKLESIKIPHTVKIIEGTAFDKCKNLKKIYVHRGINNSDNSNFFSSYGDKVEYIN